ncbi:cation diffusion facilitator family transporter [Agrobacterium tumefaciens]|uniref:cation diffusion facilitator family transporter n=1 Tax=Agrobacterium tumefaciens TaxID=358 RepID=UPI000714DE3D|nr:cation transporter [Rhizobium sp. Root564]NTC84146.1 cation transporter [Agrobacterium tumefaciens]NTD11671.1 cation transporter [Agrobacterium tumefaciens]
MSHSHEEGSHGHDHTAGANSQALGWALALTSIFLVAEVIAGIVFNSLALLSDAAHMLTDVAALAIALLAVRFGRRAADNRRTFGYKRFEVLAAAFNAVLLFAVAIYVFLEAIKRFQNPEPVGSVGMLVVAGLGLLANLVSMRILASGRNESFNVKGAYLEVWADMLGSIGVIAGAIAIYATGWTWVDPIVAVLIAIWVLPRTWILLRDTTNILLEGVPVGLQLDDVRKAISDIHGVSDVHDLHLWSMSGSEATLTAHIRVKEGSSTSSVRSEVEKVLAKKFQILHTTIETETGEITHDADLYHR